MTTLRSFAFATTILVVSSFTSSLSFAQESCCHQWQEIPTTGGPTSRASFSAVYDSVRNVTVLFGGHDGAGAGAPWNSLSDTWEWDGIAWNLRPVSGPSSRYDSAIAFDQARGVVVLFGGSAGTSGSIDELYDTWEWDGTDWALRSAGPNIGQALALEYDPNQNRVIRPGTRAWDGSTWIDIPDNDAALGGIGRDPMMVMDDARGVVMLSGGSSAYVWHNTWEWQGSGWALKDSNSPFEGNERGAYDSDRQIIVSIGAYGSGYLSDGSRVGSTMAEWDGVAWKSHATRSRPRGVTERLVYDVAHHQMTAFSFDENEPNLIVSRYVEDATCGERALPAAPTQDPPGHLTNLPKNRYLSVEAPLPLGCGVKNAIRVKFMAFRGGTAECPNVADFSAHEGIVMWVGPEVLFGAAPTGVYSLQTAPLFRDWTTVPLGALRIADCNIVPCADYQLDVVSELDGPFAADDRYSEAVIVSTSALWGDVNGDGVQNFGDISNVVDCFKNHPVTPRSACDLSPNNPKQGVLFNIDFGDISAVVDAFKGVAYPFAGPAAPLACP